jgi:hypothetical protein
LRPASLADDTDMLDRALRPRRRAIDGLRKKFGDAAVIRALRLTGWRKRKRSGAPAYRNHSMTIRRKDHTFFSAPHCCANAAR